MSWVSTDSLDMLGATAGLPEQLQAAASFAREVTGLPSPAGLAAIVVVGMGGSGVAGEILYAVGRDQLRLPVVLVGDYCLPAFVGPSTLVFAVSFSGETEETLAVAGTALRRGARLIAVTGGGRLAELATAGGATVFATSQAIPQSRAGVAATTAPLLVALERLGLLAGITPAIAAAVDQLRRRRDRLVGGGGPAFEIARDVSAARSRSCRARPASARWRPGGGRHS